MPECYDLISHENDLCCNNDDYEYDPPKNGENIIKHGLGFGEVVSYSGFFGRFIVVMPHNKNETRSVIFSDLDLSPPPNKKLEMPLDSIKAGELYYTLSIVTVRKDTDKPLRPKYRFITSRILSSKKKKCEKTIEQSLRENLDEKVRRCFLDRCIEEVEKMIEEISWHRQHGEIGGA
jgi:hypothetical protein